MHDLRRLPTLGILLAAGLAAATAAPAAGQDCGVFSGSLGNVKLGLHALTPITSAKTCVTHPDEDFRFYCGSIVSAPGISRLAQEQGTNNTWPVGTRAQVYVVALDIPEPLSLQGATFGIDYQPYDAQTQTGIYVDAWQSCLETEFPTAAPNPVWPEPGSGNAIFSSTCLGTADPTDPQGDGYAVLGWFGVTAYDPQFFSIVPSPLPPEPAVTVFDCTAAQSTLCWWGMGQVGFGMPYALDVCLGEPFPVETTTWGRIKRTRGD